MAVPTTTQPAPPGAFGAETPTVTQTPAPTVPAPPVAITQAPAAASGEEQAVTARCRHLDQQEKLKAVIVQEIAANLKVLQDELEKAPESLKPALQQAIEVARRGYEQAINNLDR